MIDNIPTWPFEPNWASGVSESLEWLTDVLTSPTGSEQRRSLRLSPRRSFEFNILAVEDARSIFDNMLVTYGASDWHLPVWHEANFLDLSANTGATVLHCADAITSEFATGSIGMLVDADAFTFELIEIGLVTETGVTITDALVSPWSRGARLYPVCRGRLTDQPRLSHRNDVVSSAEVRFQVVEPGAQEEPAYPAPSSWLTDVYRGFVVLHKSPDHRAAVDFDFDRVLVELDNRTSVPRQADQAGRPFPMQKYAWVMEGRAEQKAFRGVLKTLRGRAKPIWVPTFMRDFDLMQPIVAGNSTILVGRAGFALSGGPRWDRQDIMIETDTQRIYRRITNVAVDGSGREILVLDQPIAVNLKVNQVMRICFMALSRLNHDQVEFDHTTDSNGTSTAQLTFRSAPDTRNPLPA